MDKNTMIDYNEVLVNKLTDLSSMNFFGGIEYNVYCDDDYIIKEYESKNNFDFYKVLLSNYCTEMKEFAEKDAPIEKIYAWTTVKEGSSEKFYILEERVKGSELYGIDPADFCSGICDYYKAENIIDYPENNPEIYNKLVSKFLENQIQSNDFLINIEKNTLKRFIKACFQLNLRGKYSEPDLYPSNIIVNGDKMTLTNMPLKTSSKKVRREDYTINFYKLLINMFVSNSCITDIRNNCDLLSDYVVKKLSINDSKAVDAIVRIMSCANEYLTSKGLNTPQSFEFLRNNLDELFDKYSDKVISVLNNEVARQK